MSKLNPIFTVLIIVILAVQNLHAQTDLKTVSTLDELLQTVIRGTNADNEENQRRLQKFKAAHKEQELLLQNAKHDTALLEQTGGTLNKTIVELDRKITLLETQLSDRLGNFGELFGVTRLVAADTRSQINDSLISAQLPGRDAELHKIATGKSMPTMEQLRTLWVTLLQEQTEQGKVVRFNSDVVNLKGAGEPHIVTRVGPFVAISDGKYLTHDTSTNQLKFLARQPAIRYTSSLKRLQNADANRLVDVAIDPSRGAILNLLVQTPNLFERFKQGGIPGYVVSFLAIIGLTIGCFQLVSLWRTNAGVQRQINANSVDLGNPLGRVLHAYEENTSLNPEALEMKLDDAILKEIPRLDRGLNIVKVLAAVSPLIGLLGTVIGMILTFQAITLWGTGEPKIMAGGISQALVTTVQGLVAAIPLLLIHSIANGRARRIQQVLEEQGSGLIARRAEKLYEKNQSPLS